MVPSRPARQPAHHSSATLEAVAELLRASSNGSGAAFDELFGLLYDELRMIARPLLLEPAGWQGPMQVEEVRLRLHLR